MPYDYARKRLSVLLEDEQGARLLITKGALRNVLDACSQVITGEGEVALATVQAAVEARFQELSEAGYRTLGIARKRLAALSEGQQVSAADEAGMTFLGFLVLADPPKAGIAATIQALGALGVELKMITGDNALVARSLARQVDIAEPQLLTGSAIQQMSDAALMRQAAETNVFAEIEPNQKERIILALRRNGEVVGYMGTASTTHRRCTPLTSASR